MYVHAARVARARGSFRAATAVRGGAAAPPLQVRVAARAMSTRTRTRACTRTRARARASARAGHAPRRGPPPRDHVLKTIDACRPLSTYEY